MGKFVQVTADRVRTGMRGLEQITERDKAFRAENEALEKEEHRLREEWERKHAEPTGDTERGV